MSYSISSIKQNNGILFLVFHRPICKWKKPETRIVDRYKVQSVKYFSISKGSDIIVAMEQEKTTLRT